MPRGERGAWLAKIATEDFPPNDERHPATDSHGPANGQWDTSEAG